MEAEHGRIPPGPQEEYRVSHDLLDWMSRQFGIFGDIYKASVYGSQRLCDQEHRVCAPCDG